MSHERDRGQVLGHAGRRVATLVAVGLAAGFFSALFGVGGGLVVVPLLIGLLAYDAKVATATSLAAIIFTATFGTATHGGLGNVDWTMALLIGVPRWPASSSACRSRSGSRRPRSPTGSPCCCWPWP